MQKCQILRGLFKGGWINAPTIINNIDFVTIASTGNATDFGDLTQARMVNLWIVLTLMVDLETKYSYVRL